MTRVTIQDASDEAPRFVLTDIEGTTTDIAFVRDVLFPLSRRALPDWVAKHWDGEEVERARAATGRTDREGLVAALVGWIDQDEKAPSLKAIQGKIWRTAFESGEVRGHVYPDVPSAFRRWKAAGIRLSVFSSGSAEAQELLFRHSAYGDLTSYVRVYFDTTTGPKREPASYAAIARALEIDAGEIVFLSDVTAELDAAHASGLRTRQLLRPGITNDPRSAHRKIRTFDELDF